MAITAFLQRIPGIAYSRSSQFFKKAYAFLAGVVIQAYSPGISPLKTASAKTCHLATWLATLILPVLCISEY